MGPDSQQPLLAEDNREADESARHREHRTNSGGVRFTSDLQRSRQELQEFLSSKAQHYFVLGLVSLDLLGIFADIFINLLQCEQGLTDKKWDDIRGALGTIGLVFSSIFLVELILSVWAFGWKYFQSWFHSFDAAVIVAGFVVDVLLHGILEEVASLVVILRLWRFFKIIEEFGVGAQEQLDGLERVIDRLKDENRELKREIEGLKAHGSDSDEAA